MKTRGVWVLMLLVVALVAESRQGTVPKASADKYPASVQRETLAIGARVLPAKEADKAFFADVNRCCLIVEVALYPRGQKPINVTLDSFLLRSNGGEISVKPSTIPQLAAELQQQPSFQRDQDTSIHGSSEVAYGSGRDPATGARTRTISTGTSIEIGREAGSEMPNSDVRTIEMQLGAKALPEGETNKPVAGYLYFEVPPSARQTKKSKNKTASTGVTKQLECDLDGTRLVLNLK